ncbi:MAG: hypothetical protein IIY49_05945 [Eubacterium sp.]|nr:hypothetical protein [Eubacterium sp.]
MKSSNNKVTSITKKVKFNAASILFVVILFYIVAQMVMSLNKHPITTYKVSSSDVNDNINCTGIALRTETLIKADKNGYLVYFLRDNDKVAKGGAVCTVDETGTIVSTISDTKTSSETVFSSSDYLSVRSTIDTFKDSYSDSNFSSVYNFEATIQGKVLELSNEIMMKNYNGQTDAVKNGVSNMTSPESGIVLFYTDGYENYTPDTLPDDAFSITNYKKKAYKSGDIVNSGDIVYKLVTDEKWNLVCNLTFEQANSILEKSNQSTSQSRITFKINNSDFDITTNYDLIQKKDGYYLVLPISKYLIDYADERFLNVSIKLNAYDGLKVPNKSIVKKEAYKIPKEYFTRGGDESETNKLQVYRLDQDGNKQAVQLEPNILQSDDKFYVVDKGIFKEGDAIILMDSSETVVPEALERIDVQGVYLANKGYAEFNRVTIVNEGEEFTMIQRGENINEYDNIVMDASEVTDYQKLF